MADLGEWCDQDVGPSGCAAPYVCYVNATWNDGASLCTCSHWYGWTGADCQELSGASYFLLASVGIQGALAIVALVVATLVLASYARLHGLKPNVQVVTMLMVWLAFAFLIAWRAVVMASTLTPEENTREIKANDDGRVHELVPVERSMITLTLCFGTLALLNVSLIWVQVARGSQRMTHSISRGLTTYSRTVYAFETVWVLGLVILNVMGQTALTSVFAIPFTLFMIVCFAYGAHKMSALAGVFDAPSSSSAVVAAASEPETGSFRRRQEREASARASSYGKLIMRIRRTSLRVVACLILTFATSAIYTGLTLVPTGGQRATMKPDEVVHAIVLFNEGIPLFILCGLVFVLLYLRANILNGVRATRATARATTAPSSREMDGSKSTLPPEPRVNADDEVEGYL